MTSTRPYLRKKAVLIMYKVFLQFPEALRPAFPRLKEKLEDPDTGYMLLLIQGRTLCKILLFYPMLMRGLLMFPFSSLLPSNDHIGYDIIKITFTM